MTKIRTTLTIDADVLTAVRVEAARSGQRDSEVIEAAVRRDLGFDMLDRLWASADLDEPDAMDLAIEGQKAARAARTM